MIAIPEACSVLDLTRNNGENNVFIKRFHKTCLLAFAVSVSWNSGAKLDSDK